MSESRSQQTGENMGLHQDQDHRTDGSGMVMNFAKVAFELKALMILSLVACHCCETMSPGYGGVHNSSGIGTADVRLHAVLHNQGAKYSRDHSGSKIHIPPPSPVTCRASVRSGLQYVQATE